MHKHELFPPGPGASSAIEGQRGHHCSLCLAKLRLLVLKAQHSITSAERFCLHVCSATFSLSWGRGTLSRQKVGQLIAIVRRSPLLAPSCFLMNQPQTRNVESAGQIVTGLNNKRYITTGHQHLLLSSVAGVPSQRFILLANKNLLGQISSPAVWYQLDPPATSSASGVVLMTSWEGQLRFRRANSRSPTLNARSMMLCLPQQSLFGLAHRLAARVAPQSIMPDTFCRTVRLCST